MESLSWAVQQEKDGIGEQCHAQEAPAEADNLALAEPSDADLRVVEALILEERQVAREAVVVGGHNADAHEGVE